MSFLRFQWKNIYYYFDLENIKHISLALTLLVFILTLKILEENFLKKISPQILFLLLSASLSLCFIVESNFDTVKSIEGNILPFSFQHYFVLFR